MKCSKNICLTLISLLGAATIGLTSCKDQPDEYKSTTGSPEIQYVRLPESADSVITKSYHLSCWKKSPQHSQDAF